MTTRIFHICQFHWKHHWAEQSRMALVKIHDKQVLDFSYQVWGQQRVHEGLCASSCWEGMAPRFVGQWSTGTKQTQLVTIVPATWLYDVQLHKAHLNLFQMQNRVVLDVPCCVRIHIASKDNITAWMSELIRDVKTLARLNYFASVIAMHTWIILLIHEALSNERKQPLLSSVVQLLVEMLIVLQFSMHSGNVDLAITAFWIQ